MAMPQSHSRTAHIFSSQSNWNIAELAHPGMAGTFVYPPCRTGSAYTASRVGQKANPALPNTRAPTITVLPTHIHTHTHAHTHTRTHTDARMLYSLLSTDQGRGASGTCRLTLPSLSRSSMSKHSLALLLSKKYSTSSNST